MENINKLLPNLPNNVKCIYVIQKYRHKYNFKNIKLPFGCKCKYISGKNIYIFDDIEIILPTPFSQSNSELNYNSF
jgi:hypothetical protein